MDVGTSPRFESRIPFKFNVLEHFLNPFTPANSKSSLHSFQIIPNINNLTETDKLEELSMKVKPDIFPYRFHIILNFTSQKYLSLDG